MDLKNICKFWKCITYWCVISLTWCRIMVVHKCCTFRLKRINLLSPTPDACCALLALRSIQLMTGEPRPPVQRTPVTWHEWGLWFDPTLNVQQVTQYPQYDSLQADFYKKKYDYIILYHICWQWNGRGSWNSPLRNARTWLFSWSITRLLMAWWCNYPRHQQAWYGHGINIVCTEYYFVFPVI